MTKHGTTSPRLLPRDAGIPAANGWAELLLAACVLACSACDRGDATSEPASGEGTAPQQTAATADATGHASGSEVLAAAPQEEPEGFTAFSGAPDLGDDAPSRAFQGVQFAAPKGWSLGEIYLPDELLGGVSNKLGTAKGRFYYTQVDDPKTWASPKAIADSQGERTATVTQSGEEAGKIAVPSWCEDAVFRGTAVHPKKQRWQDEPEAATFGAAELPGSVLQGKDDKGRWKLYCVRIAATDEVGVLGGIGHRLDKDDSEELAAQVAAVLKSFRPAKTK